MIRREGNEQRGRSCRACKKEVPSTKKLAIPIAECRLRIAELRTKMRGNAKRFADWALRSSECGVWITD